MAIDAGPPWLLLIHQLPAKPAYVRVKIWRRLQALGAVTVKNAVYALPANADTREDFAWLAKEIVESEGEAIVCEANFIEGLNDSELRALFDGARDEDYGRIAGEVRELGARLSADTPDGPLADIASQTAKLRKQLDQVVAIDFFGAEGRAAAEGLVSGLEAALKQEDTMADSKKPAPPPGPLRDRLWVTRQGVQVDRIASAWLIRRFIDPGARFKFVPGTGYGPQPGELRFDMFEGEFTHIGDRCTFEVLLDHAGLDEPALRAIGEVIHDIDLKDGKYGREEVAGVRTLINGIAASSNDDERRLARGSALLDDLYSSFGGKA
ncbi:chromate resistance protein ChrB domain-containing protein [Reyranella sp.]|uniref:chromate resistance protein ChrB domain-containing protein n=1 Tax=Reyranella sp. TaxID=1929291 RepID=UPI0025FF3761|nr:chromate resistance protein ChrB domain-containing protein [Reyranella sp.]